MTIRNKEIFFYVFVNNDINKKQDIYNISCFWNYLSFPPYTGKKLESP